jgi:glycosyltransferase involved in cell wall biosynthesis
MDGCTANAARKFGSDASHVGGDVSQLNAFPRISVVVPARNEAANLPTVFGGVDPAYEVILVDGRSVDDTVATAHRLRPNVKVVQQTRRGKGNALACGFAAATGDIIVMLDADGSAEPREIPRFVRALVEGADFAKGTRFSVGGGSSDLTRMRRLGNKALNGLVNVTYSTRYSDLCYGYNAFWRYCLPVINLEPGEPSDKLLWGDGFEIETLINIRIAAAKLRVVEVPSFEACRIHGVSNLNAVTDGLRVLRTIAAEKRRTNAPTYRNGAHDQDGVDLAGVRARHRYFDAAAVSSNDGMVDLTNAQVG